MIGMATFEKDILYPGQVQPPDLDGSVTFTAENAASGVTNDGRISVPFLAARMKEMIDAGLQIPVSWEHQPTAKPLTARERNEQRAELAKLTLGHATMADMHPEGFASARVEIPVDEDAKRLRAIRFVSPAIDWDVQDGNGKLWPGPSITHLAATPRPVQHRQKPFQPVKLSQAATPKRPAIRLSLGSYIQLGESPMADVKKDGDEGAGKKEGAAAGTFGIKEAMEQLKSFDPPVVLLEDTTDENFVERLCAALEAIKGAKGTPADAGADTGTQPETDAQPPPGIMMSLQGRILKMERQDLERRIKAIRESGRIGKPIYDRMTTELKSIKLSLGKDGEVADNILLSKVKDYEALPEGSAWPMGQKPIHLSEGEVDLDAVDGSPLDDDQAIAAIGEVWGTRRRVRA